MNAADHRAQKALLPFLLCVAVGALFWFVILPDMKERNAAHRAWVGECRAAGGDVVHTRHRGGEVLCLQVLNP